VRSARGALVAAVLAAGLLLALGGHAAPARMQATGPVLGLLGDPARFKEQTGQETLIRHAFIGWGQGQTFAGTLATLIPQFGPIPMLDLGTGGVGRKEFIKPREIAQGKGDSYLIALNEAITKWGKGIYVRPMFEMNNYNKLYAGYAENGQQRGEDYSTANFRKAFARIYVILHGGTLEDVNADLKALGLPAVQGVVTELFSNPFPRLRIVWSPLGGGNPRVPGNAPEQYYPGVKYVDVEGGDIYDEGIPDAAPWSAIETLHDNARKRGKPFSIPEWGLYSIDDPVFVDHMCRFLKSHPATEAALFYESKPGGSTFDLSDKPKSRAVYRSCITPLGAPMPAWATTPDASVVTLELTPNPDAGPPPLAVKFAINAKLTVPIVHWRVLFGDGQQLEGNGVPPVSVNHNYAKAGVYQALLVVYHGPPFGVEDARFFTSADVSVGTTPPRLVTFEPSKTSGPVPLKVSFKIETDIPEAVKTWKIIWGDGNTLDGTGAPPHFTGHTFGDDGDFQVLLLLEGGRGGQWSSVALITAGAGGGGPPPPPPPPPPPSQQGPTPTATETGTVLVNGQPFNGGPIPYNSNVDVTNGTVTITIEDVGKLKAYGEGKVPAKFKLLRFVEKGKVIVELRLQGGNFKVCPKRKTSSVSATGKTPVRQVWGDGKGKFRTKGRYSSATVRGTNWLTSDRCAGTFTRVKKGVVEVRDFPKRRTLRLPAPRTYLATP
jgi:hypothetical protein